MAGDSRLAGSPLRLVVSSTNAVRAALGRPVGSDRRNIAMSSKPSRCQRVTSEYGARARSARQSGHSPQSRTAPRNRRARPGAAVFDGRQPADEGVPIEGRWAAVRRALRWCAAREQLGFPAAGGKPLDDRTRRRVARCRRSAAGPSGSPRRRTACLGRRATGQGCPPTASAVRIGRTPTAAVGHRPGRPRPRAHLVLCERPLQAGSPLDGEAPPQVHGRRSGASARRRKIQHRWACTTRAGWSLPRGRPAVHRPVRHRPHAYRLLSCGGP